MKIEKSDLEMIEESLKQINTVLSANIHKLTSVYNAYNPVIRLYPVTDILNFCKENEELIVRQLDTDKREYSNNIDLVMDIIKIYELYTKRKSLYGNVELDFIVHDICKFNDTMKRKSLNDILEYIDTVATTCPVRLHIIYNDGTSQTKVAINKEPIEIDHIENVFRLIIITTLSCVVADTVPSSDKEILRRFIIKHSNDNITYSDAFVDRICNMLTSSNSKIPVDDIAVYVANMESTPEIVLKWWEIYNDELNLNIKSDLFRYGGSSINNIDLDDIVAWIRDNNYGTIPNAETYYRDLIKRYKLQKIADKFGCKDDEKTK